MNDFTATALGYQGPRITLMEVCGTHTMAIARHGLQGLLSQSIRLISGPGCPVCVTDDRDLDAVMDFAEERHDAIITTFGDMVRVPGSDGRTLAALRAGGADVRVIYSATGALEIARQNPGRETIFLGVGFETTAPSSAAVLSEAAAQKVLNFRLLSLHKLVPPVLRELLHEGEAPIDGLILPGHVCAVTGPEAFEFLPGEFGVGGVVTGFDPVDILSAVGMLIHQIQCGRPAIENAYTRVVAPRGNQAAKAALAEAFVTADANWRGLGRISGSGLSLAGRYSDMEIRLTANAPRRQAHPCLCGEVLRGRIEPSGCPSFGKACTPQNPVGPCMVSNEGACAAHFRFREVSA